MRGPHGFQKLCIATRRRRQSVVLWKYANQWRLDLNGKHSTWHFGIQSHLANKTNSTSRSASHASHPSMGWGDGGMGTFKKTADGRKPIDFILQKLSEVDHDYPIRRLKVNTSCPSLLMSFT